MSESILDKLEALDKAATAGPWNNRVVIATLRTSDGYIRAILGAGPYHSNPGLLETEKKADFDAELIALMRNALPALLKVVRAAEDYVHGDGDGRDDVLAALQALSK